MVLYPLAIPSALVLDVGHTEATVTGVFAYHMEQRSFGCCGKGAAAVHGCE